MLTFTFYNKKIMEKETMGRDGMRPDASIASVIMTPTQ